MTADDAVRVRWILPILLVALAGCGLDIAMSTDGKDPTIVQGTRSFRAQLEIERLEAELGQYEAMRGEWPDDWSFRRRATLDPWGGEYVFDIVDGSPVVVSAGSDGELDTDDDVYGTR